MLTMAGIRGTALRGGRAIVPPWTGPAPSIITQNYNTAGTNFIAAVNTIDLSACDMAIALVGSFNAACTHSINGASTAGWTIEAQGSVPSYTSAQISILKKLNPTASEFLRVDSSAGQTDMLAFYIGVKNADSLALGTINGANGPGNTIATGALVLPATKDAIFWSFISQYYDNAGGAGSNGVDTPPSGYTQDNYASWALPGHQMRLGRKSKAAATGDTPGNWIDSSALNTSVNWNGLTFAAYHS